jgi:hypothetical protein
VARKKNTVTQLLQNITAFPHKQFNLIHGLIYERDVLTSVFMCGEFFSTKNSLEYFFFSKRKSPKIENFLKNSSSFYSSFKLANF